MNSEMGYKVGLIEIKLFRPWPEEYFLRALPESVESIVVMDRTREDGTN
jgi:pyruvate-ferredoxin/flavodoxin oxidoreductase